MLGEISITWKENWKGETKYANIPTNIYTRSKATNLHFVKHYIVTSLQIIGIDEKRFLFLYNGGIFSGQPNLLALYLSGTPSLKTATRPPSCIHLDNRLYMMPGYLTFGTRVPAEIWTLF